ncbi:OLC1v1013976C1 [Oldenlandia corymbosa var. corymbosa]|uniref:OLC1v1013976C1 n=1 Tax=Oldenlandia corymbosa var. corymbosa TaxID=529605 RepID=A0AAV1E311_OLDCO|nr:OLC1v1013976C1 [Oldenlandia corymbosa var. corymbosa]
MAPHDLGDSDSTETPKKRFKTEDPTLENSSPKTPLSFNGINKLQPCGICFSEAAQDDRNSVSRGCIDSCDHYFCFVCIMEWAKVESKCPLCKRRFSTILRPAKPPVFPSDRLIHIPERNQVYYESGNATIGPDDPYSESKCSICQSCVDDTLLLLCDLCDSAAHTYCVGLGITIPEGDWFCRDCALVRDEHNKVEGDVVSHGEKNCNDLNESQVKGEEVSVFDIVREPRNGVAGRSSTTGLISVPRDNDVSTPDSRTDELILNGASATNPAARTLRQCRDVHDRIKLLRDNWNGIRSGSLPFLPRQRDSRHTADIYLDSGQSSSSQNRETVNGLPVRPESTGSSGSTSFSVQKVKTTNVSPEKPAIDISSSQSSSTAAKVTVSCPGTTNERDYEISRAWKMLNKAKSIEQRERILHPKSSSLKRPLSNRHLERSDKLPAVRKDRDSDRKIHNIQKYQMPEKQNLCNPRSRSNSIDYIISPSPIERLSTSSHIVCCSFQRDVQNGSDQILREKFFESPHAAFNHCGSSIRVSSSGDSATAASDLHSAGHELSSLLSCKKDPSMAKDAEDKIPVHRNAMKNDDSKIEIKSLVKLNLKILAKSRKLEIAVYKQIAWSATHSILVACGLEYPKTGIRQFSSSICCHKESDLQFQRSTLMPSSCRECFYVFVKDVVNTIMLEKIANRDVL